MKPIPGIAKYSITENGQVYSYFSNKFLKASISNARPGYKTVELYGKHKTVHSLVALTYIGPRPEQLVVNHKDRNPLNNKVSNLEYITQAENMKHIPRGGTGRGQSKWMIGVDNPNVKLQPADILKIREYHSLKLYTYKQLSLLFHISKDTIKDIVTRRSWRHL